MGQDLRRHPRVAPQVGYFLSCVTADCSERPYSLSTRLLDVSQGGACVATTGRLQERLPVLLDVRLPDLGRFRARALVAWSSTDPERRHLAGLRFERVFEADDVPVPDAPRPPADPRRRHKRYFPGRADPVFTLPTLWSGLGFRAKNRAVRLLDLSQGGAQLICDDRLLPELVGDLALDFCRPRVQVHAEVRIVWCRRNTLLLTPEWHVGLAFRKVAEPESLGMLARCFLG